MTRNELERYLGRCVTITLLDNTVIEGTLHKTGEKAFENDPNLSVPVNFYFCIDVNNKVVKNTAFRVSHIRRISCCEKLRMTNFEKIKQMKEINKMKYYEINETAARQARECWSFRDYQHGSKTAEYKAKVDECYSLVDKLPDDLKEKGTTMADRYARRLAEWYNKQFRIEMMCPSVMISGGSNFPVRKKEKQNAARDRHYQLYDEIQKIPEKIKGLLRGTNIIKSGEADALEQLRKKAEKAEALQTEMKAVNAYYRKNKTLKGYKDYTDERAIELDKAIKESMYGVPFPPYALTNNNAKIRNTKARIKQLERLKEAAETATEQPKDEYKTDLFEVVENADIMRLQLKFDGKPDADTRTVLKQNGFRWSPSNGVWQRQLTDNANFALERVIKELKVR